MKTFPTMMIVSAPLAGICMGLLAMNATEARGQDRNLRPPEPTHTAPAAQAQSESSKKAAAPAKVDLEYLFQQLDTNNDGKLSREEFNGLSSMLASLVAPAIKDNDKDKSGTVGVAQVAAGSVTGLKDPEGLFRKLDTNGDGKLTPAEFKKIGPLLEQTQKDPTVQEDAAKKADAQKKADADKGTNLPAVGAGGSSSGARDSATGR